MLGEVQAIQAYLLAVTGNIQAMPNLDSALAACDMKIKQMDAAIAERVPPEDLKKQVDAQGELIVQVDCRTSCSQLATEIEALKSEKLGADLLAAKTQAEKIQGDAKFRSDHCRDNAAFKAGVTQVLDEIKMQVKRIEGLVSLQQAVSKLQNLG